MQKIPWYQKIQIQIPLIVFLIILIPAAAFGSYDVSTSRQSQRQNAETAMSERLYETSLLMQDAMQELENAGKKLAENTAFLELLKEYQNAPVSVKTRSGLLLAMGQSAWPCGSMEEMYLFTDGSPWILSSDPEEKLLNRDGSGQELFRKFRDEMQGKTAWISLSDSGTGDAQISYWRSLSAVDGQAAASLVCVLKKESLASVMNSLQSREMSLNVIGSYQGKALYCDSPQTVMTDRLTEDPLFSQAYAGPENAGSYFARGTGGRWLVTYYNSLDDGWKYASAVPERQIYTGIADRKFLFVLLAAGLISVLFGSLALYRLVVRPLGKLQKKMELMEKGQLETLDFRGGKNEIGLVLLAYNHMIIRLKKLIDEVYVQQLLRKQAELSSLQSQMDEHFLYNTLNTVYCKASEEKADVSAAMILKLSQYFRLSLSKGQEKIPLNEIAELIRSYLQIQQMRYGQTLKCRIETFPGMEQYISLKQLYQPIIENAVIHGFEKKLGNHSLRICFQKTENRIRFTVQDDGVGMTEDMCREILAEPGAFDPVQGKGYALRNIREQIRIAYGEDCDLKIESCPGEGTTVVLEVLLEKSERKIKCKEMTEPTTP